VAPELLEISVVVMVNVKTWWRCHGNEIELSLAVFIQVSEKLTPRILLSSNAIFIWSFKSLNSAALHVHSSISC